MSTLYNFPEDEAVDFADYLIACTMHGAPTKVAVQATMKAFFREGRWVWRDGGRGRRLRSREWDVTRQRILERDSYQCSYCPDDADEVDHIKPLAQGGVHDDWNLTASCGACNRSKGSKSLADWQGRRQ